MRVLVEGAGKLPVARHSDLAEFFGSAIFSEADTFLTGMTLNRVHVDDVPAARWSIVMEVQFFGTCNTAVLPLDSMVMTTGLVETVRAAESRPTPEKTDKTTNAPLTAIGKAPVLKGLRRSAGMGITEDSVRLML